MGDGAAGVVPSVGDSSQCLGVVGWVAAKRVAESVADAPHVDHESLGVGGEPLPQSAGVAIDRSARRAISPHAAQQFLTGDHKDILWTLSQDEGADIEGLSNDARAQGARGIDI